MTAQAPVQATRATAVASPEAGPLGSDLYSPAAGVRTFSLSGRSLLYVEDQQQVLELNQTADRIWRALAATGSVSAAARDLGGLGLSPEQAAQLVAEAASQWTLGGYLAPRSLGRLLAAGDPADRTLVLDELVVEVRLLGVDCEPLDPVFGHLYGAGEGARRRLTIIGHAGQLLFYVEQRLVCVAGRDGLVAHVKAVLTDLYADGLENAFLTHGALLIDGERRLLLSGEPGAGKTTLALALAGAGWRYGGDDIVRVTPEAMAQGVPFAATVKSGSVPLLCGMWPELEHLPVSVRSDAQPARYLLPPQRAETSPGPLNLVVTLARRPGAAAEARTISALDGLNAILQGAYARRWRMTGEALCALAQSLERARCVRLEYSDLAAAVQVIEELARVQAQAA